MMKRSSRLKGMMSGSLAAIGLALAIGVLMPVVSVPAFAVVVNFPDPGLEAAIREAIGKSTGDIYDTDLTRLEVLDANDRGIVDLEGIQHCVGLTELSLNSKRYARLAESVALEY